MSAWAFGLAESTGPGGSNAQAVNDLGYRGQGVSIGLISTSHIRDTHEAFKDVFGNPRAFNIIIGSGIVSPPPELPNHDTQAAGIAMARGTGSRPDDDGAAPAAGLYSVAISTSSDFANAVKALVEAPQNCRVIMTVIQDTNTSENSFLPLLYDYYAYTYNVVFANPAGNNISSSYPYDTPLTNPGTAYNGITTGGLITTSSTAVYDKIGSLSLAGPTADGRQKPDVCAPSPWQMAPAYSSDTAWATTPGSTQGYTSYAVPHTAGVAAVLLSYADATAIANDGRNEVIRAVIVNAAFANILDKAGNPTIAPDDADWPWNTDRGYGRLDALRAFETLNAPQITPGVSTGSMKGWTYDILSVGEANSYPIAGTVNERLIATLTWNRRVEWQESRGPGSGIIQPGELTGSLANLDLEIRDPDGVLVSPASSTVDNLEKADLLLAKTGTYQIRVVNQSPDAYAGYGLAFEILPPLGGDVHVDYVVDTLDAVALAEHWLSTGCDNTAAACFAYNLSSNARIDLTDFAVLAENWLATDARYYTP